MRIKPGGLYRCYNGSIIKIDDPDEEPYDGINDTCLIGRIVGLAAGHRRTWNIGERRSWNSDGVYSGFEGRVNCTYSIAKEIEP